jgi:hypothetical protein
MTQLSYASHFSSRRPAHITTFLATTPSQNYTKQKLPAEKNTNRKFVAHRSGGNMLVFVRPAIETAAQLLRSPSRETATAADLALAFSDSLAFFRALG